MTAEELKSLSILLFGKRGWQIGCARFLRRDDGSHVNVRTIRRWAKGESQVPFWVEGLMRAELERRAT
jgi:hypothetical protein